MGRVAPSTTAAATSPVVRPSVHDGFRERPHPSRRMCLYAPVEHRGGSDMAQRRRACLIPPEIEMRRHGNSSDVFMPRPVKGLQGLKIKQIACGDNHCLAVTTAGEVQSWGRNQNGQLGLGTTEDSLLPQKIQAFQGEAFVPESIVRFGKRTGGRDGVITIMTDDERIKYQGLHHGSSYLEHLNFLSAIRAQDASGPSVNLNDGLLSVAIGVAGQLSIEEGRFVSMEEILGS